MTHLATVTGWAAMAGRSRLLESPVASRERLVELLATRTSGPDGRLVVVRGLPGSGVTTLVRNLVERQRSRGTHAAYVPLDVVEKDVHYAALERIYFAVPWLRDLATTLDVDADPIDVGRRFVDAYLTHAPTKQSRLLLAIDPACYCDPSSAVVLRYAAARLISRGTVVVIGDNLTRPTELGRYFAESATDPAGADLVSLPDLTPEEISALVQDRAGTGVSKAAASQIHRLTQGRFAAVCAYLDGVPAAALLDVAHTRSLPLSTSARMCPPWRVPLTDLPEATHVATQTCALAGRGVSGDIMDAVFRALGIADPGPVADGVVVQQHALTGVLLLADPLSREDILFRADPARVRAISEVLARSTHGLESHLHELRALAAMSPGAVDHIQQVSAHMESTGQYQDAVELLYAAREQARGTEQYPRLSRAFGLACIRLHAVSDHLPHLMELGADPTDPYAAFIYCNYRTFKDGYHFEARLLREAYLSAPPRGLDHEFMQAEVAVLDLLLAILVGSSTAGAAHSSARDRLTPLLGRQPNEPALRWLDPATRLALVDSLAAVADAEARSRDETLQLADTIRDRSGGLPRTSAERGDLLVVAAMLLDGIGEFTETLAVLAELDGLRTAFTRPMLLAGQRTVVSIDVNLRTGDWATARKLLDDALPHLADGFDPSSWAVVPSMHAWLLAVTGHLEEAARFAEIARGPRSELSQGHGRMWLALAQAEIANQAEGPAAALAHVQQDVAGLTPTDHWWLLVARLEYAVESGDRAAAHAALTEARTHLDTHGLTHSEVLSYLEGLLAAADDDLQGAIEHYTKALGGLGHPYVEGRCRLALGRANQRLRGHHGAAVEAFAAARDVFATIGAVAYMNHAERLLRQGDRDHARRLVLLSIRERRVAELASRGWTNKEIARELRISTATAAFHMSNVLKKLELSRRSEL